MEAGAAEGVVGIVNSFCLASGSDRGNSSRVHRVVRAC